MRTENPARARRRSLIPAAAASAVVLLGLAGCSAGDAGEDGDDRVNVVATTSMIGDIVYADVLRLRDARGHSLIRTLDTNRPAAAANIRLTEAAAKYDATVILMVENVSIDTIWLGMRVRSSAPTGHRRSPSR